ncbi:MAG: Acyl-CoA synthetase (AMP-forming)/AMP-acid ligase II [Promethearchaeota archaeon]|nr:MAG: Acyl-CoA synthetase (AMP-forming)/AMP-acid ligase II [Candidatus Lokiarchaeota archaeon]
MTEKGVKRYWDKSWPQETPKHIDYDEIPLGEVLRRTVKTYPDSQAIFFEGWRCTYKELDEMVDKFATGLSKLGIGKGDVVCIDLPNVPQYVIAHYAILRLGAVSNPILPVNRFVEIVHQVNDSSAKLMIVLDYLYEEYLDGKDLSKMPTLKHIVLTGLKEYLPKIKGILGTLIGKVPRMKEWPKRVGEVHFHEYQAILEKGMPINIPKINIDVKNDPAILIYTGGTTGVPKGVVTTHYNMVSNAQQTDIWATTQLEEMRKAKGKGGMMLVVPLAHSYGNIASTVGILEGWKLILLPRPPEKISKILKVIKKEEATYMPGVPTLYIKINQDPDSKKYKGQLESLIACISAASPLPEEVKNEFEAITDALIVEGYGMSECSPVISLNPFKASKTNTVGLPLPDTLIKIADIEEPEKTLPQCPKNDCTQCGADETKYIGEICIAGPQVMKEYLNRPDATSNALRKDENNIIWLYSSDIGCIDKDGYTHIKDRKRDMIKYKGHSVFPREVEDLMYMHPAINEVGVIGIPDEKTGQNIKAFVSLKSEYQGKVSKEDLLEWSKENISAYKYPREIEVVPELPKTVIGKILRRELRKGQE